MANKNQYELTQEQAERDIKMCLDNAWSYLDDADMYESNKRIDHVAIPIEFAMEEIGKTKIIYDKTLQNNSKISLSYKDGIYSHETKMEKAVSLIELDISDEIGEAMMMGDVVLGLQESYPYFLDEEKVAEKQRHEKELKNIENRGHGIRLRSSFVDFDKITNEPKIEKSTGDLTNSSKHYTKL